MISIGSWDNAEYLADLLGCKLENLPIKYLSLPLGSKYKDVGMWELVIESFEKRLAS